VRSSRIPRIPSRLAIAVLSAALSLAASCRQEPRIRVTLAEFQDENLDGEAGQDETIVLVLSDPLPEEFDPRAARVESPDLGIADLDLALAEDRRSLVVRIRAGKPRLSFAGVHGVDDGASGLAVDLGDGIRQEVDLQVRRRVPLLLAATWVDSSPAGGNGVVDEGDRLRLTFDHPVEIAAGERPLPVEVPEHVLLSKESDIDRLDDGGTPSFWAPADSDGDEVDIVLGSNPVLRVAGELPRALSESQRRHPETPSGLAINGTDLQPMPWIAAAGGGGPGVASAREVDIELPRELKEKLARFAAGTRRLLSGSGSRSLHSLTPFLDRYAVVAGGIDVEVTPQRVLKDLLLLDCQLEGEHIANEVVIPLADLLEPVYQHTSTSLPGPDRKAGTADDLVVIAGGTSDGVHALPGITVVFLSRTGFQALRLATELSIARAGHVAVAVRHDQLLIDGGWSDRHPSGRKSLVASAELLTIRRQGDSILVEGRTVFRTHPRTRHTLTLVDSGDPDDPWVLAYGGLGRLVAPAELGDPVDPADPENYVAEDSAVVLYCPTLLRVADPRASVVKLDLKLHPSFLRHGHRAVEVDARTSEGLVAAREVLVFGGSNVHPWRSPPPESTVQELWEIDPLQLFTELGNVRPSAESALHGVLVSFDRAAPAASRIGVVPHPAPRPEALEPRQEFTMTPVDGLGVVIAGGETAGKDSRLLSTVEIYFTGGPLQGQVRELAWSLATPRSRHSAYPLLRDGRRFLLLFGGKTPGGAGREPSAGTDVEVFPLP
jgi:hypothetical protein